MGRGRLRKQAQRILSRKQRDSGLNLGPLGPYLFKRFLDEAHDEKISLADFGTALDDFVRDELPELQAVLGRGLSTVQSDIANAQLSKLAPRRLYGRSLKRRIEIVRYVSERVVPFRHLIGLTLSTENFRVRWKAVLRAWNCDHPNDAMTVDTLRAAWNYAKRDLRLQLTVFARLVRHQRTVVAAFERFVPTLASGEFDTSSRGLPLLDFGWDDDASQVVPVYDRPSRLSQAFIEQDPDGVFGTASIPELLTHRFWEICWGSEPRPIWHYAPLRAPVPPSFWRPS